MADHDSDKINGAAVRLVDIFHSSRSLAAQFTDAPGQIFHRSLTPLTLGQSFFSEIKCFTMEPVLFFKAGKLFVKIV